MVFCIIAKPERRLMAIVVSLILLSVLLIYDVLRSK